MPRLTRGAGNQAEQLLKLASDCVLVRRDGVEIAIEDSAAPIHDRTGQVTGAVIVFHDASDSREMKWKRANSSGFSSLSNVKRDRDTTSASRCVRKNLL